MKNDTCPALQKLSVALVLIALFGASFFLCFRADICSTAPVFGKLNDEDFGFASTFLNDRNDPYSLDHLTPIEQKFVKGSGDLDELQHARELYESDPENILFVSLYAEMLIREFDSDSEKKPELKLIREILNHWKKLDPDNAMPWFLMAHAEFLTGYKMEIDDQGEKTVYNYTVLDSKAVERGILEYRTGLTKKYAKAYAAARHKERLRLANYPKTPFGVIKKIEVSAATLLPYLSSERALIRTIAHYTKELHAKGNVQEAAELLASGRTYLLLRMEEKETYFISALVHIAINTIWLETAKELENKEYISVYAPVTERFEAWKKMPDPNQETIVRHGGILAAILCPALKEKIDPELLTPERMVNYILIDQLNLIFLFHFVILISVILLLIGLIGLCFKRYPDWNLPGSSCIRIYLFGLILPLLIHLVYIHIDCLSGRDMSPSWDPLRTALPCLYILFILPIWFFIAAVIELKVRLKKRFFPIIWTLLALFAGFMFMTSAILSPVYRAEINYYVEQDELCNTEEGFTSLESAVAKKFYRDMYEDLNRIKKGVPK